MGTMIAEVSPGRAQDAVQSLLDTLVAEGREIGVHVVAYHREECVVDAHAGIADAANGQPVDSDRTLFNVFSVAKAVTATAVHLQAERGLIAYDAPLATYWPEFSGDGRESVTVHHVLTHRSGMHAMKPTVTPEEICDWHGMARWLAQQKPLGTPGEQSFYQSMTFGWLLGEIVRRTDPQRRDFGRFVHEEIGLPLGAPDLWLGIPEVAQARVAIMDGSAVQVIPEGVEYRTTCPIQVDLMPEPFGRPDLRTACIPAVGGIFSARSEARFFAMLANGGTLGGVRLLSPERVAYCTQPRENAGEADPVFFGMQVPVGMGGFWLGGAEAPPVCAPRNPRALCHPGMGGSLGCADMDRKLAVAFCHNRLFDALTPEDDSRTKVGDTIRAALGIV